MDSTNVESTTTPWIVTLSRLGRVLTFRIRRTDIELFDWRCLFIGIVCVLVVGVGRHWDDPNVVLLQRLGIGSLLYVVLLSYLLWIVIRPVAKHSVSYLQTLTFVTLTAPPAVLYAVPIQWWVEPADAIRYNLNALIFVSLYRVGLLATFYRRAGQLGVGGTVITTLLPLSFIVTILAITRSGTATAFSMGGIREESLPVTEQIRIQISDVIVHLGCFSVILFPVFLIAYLSMLENLKSPTTTNDERSDSCESD